jgi:hypothetical protein
MINTSEARVYRGDSLFERAMSRVPHPHDSLTVVGWGIEQMLDRNPTLQAIHPPCYRLEHP